MRAVNFTRHLNKTWGNIAGPRTLIHSVEIFGQNIYLAMMI